MFKIRYVYLNENMRLLFQILFNFLAWRQMLKTHFIRTSEYRYRLWIRIRVVKMVLYQHERALPVHPPLTSMSVYAIVPFLYALYEFTFCGQGMEWKRKSLCFFYLDQLLARKELVLQNVHQLSLKKVQSLKGPVTRDFHFRGTITGPFSSCLPDLNRKPISENSKRFLKCETKKFETANNRYKALARIWTEESDGWTHLKLSVRNTLSHLEDFDDGLLRSEQQKKNRHSFCNYFRDKIGNYKQKL